MTGQPYQGPLLVATPAEAQLIEILLAERRSAGDWTQESIALQAKCAAVRKADPRFQQPTR